LAQDADESPHKAAKREFSKEIAYGARY